MNKIIIIEDILKTNDIVNRRKNKEIRERKRKVYIKWKIKP